VTLILSSRILHLGVIQIVIVSFYILVLMTVLSAKVPSRRTACERGTINLLS
jgi:hypothetical protein